MVSATLPQVDLQFLPTSANASDQCHYEFICKLYMGNACHYACLAIQIASYGHRTLIGAQCWNFNQTLSDTTLLGDKSKSHLHRFVRFTSNPVQLLCVDRMDGYSVELSSQFSEAASTFGHYGGLALLFGFGLTLALAPSLWQPQLQMLEPACQCLQCALPHMVSCGGSSPSTQSLLQAIHRQRSSRHHVDCDMGQSTT